MVSFVLVVQMKSFVIFVIASCILADMSRDMLGMGCARGEGFESFDV